MFEEPWLAVLCIVFSEVFFRNIYELVSQDFTSVKWSLSSNSFDVWTSHLFLLKWASWMKRFQVIIIGPKPHMTGWAWKLVPNLWFFPYFKACLKFVQLLLEKRATSQTCSQNLLEIKRHKWDLFNILTVSPNNYMKWRNLLRCCSFIAHQLNLK